MQLRNRKLYLSEKVSPLSVFLRVAITEFSLDELCVSSLSDSAFYFFAWRNLLMTHLSSGECC